VPQLVAPDLSVDRNLIDMPEAADSVVDDDFFARCRQYRSQLQQARGFEQIQQLWRATRIDYSMPALDPGSLAYRDTVLAVYERLTNAGYHADNELTSTKQSAEDFRLGYPWVARDLGVAAAELGKTVQALLAMQRMGGRVRSVVEFGGGWGNLAVPLAKLGLDVAVVDIDQAFLDRAQDLARRDGFELDVHQGDFVEVADRLPSAYDVAIFQSSFHHCLDFEVLMQRLADRVLAENGRIFFFAEPIHRDFAFPWGLRSDGESLWAIMCNGWLELGFDEDFFLQMALRHGFFVSRVDGLPGLVGDGWMATRARHGIAFAEWALPAPCSQSFWDRAPQTEYGRFLRRSSKLPVLAATTPRYKLHFRNFCTQSLSLTLRGDSGESLTRSVAAGELVELVAPASRVEPLHLSCDTVVPDRLIGNGDLREIGLALSWVAAA
jgi:2-polyprenyl-3-methyl-5-hydroxy-6-metoxy-1,4-benzoquinol methylase